MNLEKLFELNPLAIAWDGLDGAIIGMASKKAKSPIIVTYVDEGEYHTYELEDDDGEEPLDRWGRIEFGPVVAYDTNKIINILMENMGEDSLESDEYSDAIEHFEYNINGAYVGEFTPFHILVYDSEE